MLTVYKHTNLTNGKSYIGITNKTCEARWEEHCYWANRKSMFTFHCAIRKYGIEDWTHTVLHTVETIEEAKRLEIEMIALHDTFAAGYNMTTGGDGMRGLTRTAEHCRKISEAHKGRSKTEATKEKLRAYKGEKASFFGKTHSEEWHTIMRKMRSTMVYATGADNKHSKSFVIIYPDRHEETITGLVEFCRTHGLSHAVMSRIASGRSDFNKGYSCRHLDDAKRAKADEVKAKRIAERTENWRAAAEKSRPPKRITDIQIQQIRAAFEADFYRGFWGETARKFGVSNATVRNICLNLGAYKVAA